jgi:hypothetical protein
MRGDERDETHPPTGQRGRCAHVPGVDEVPGSTAHGTPSTATSPVPLSTKKTRRLRGGDERVRRRSTRRCGSGPIRPSKSTTDVRPTRVRTGGPPGERPSRSIPGQSGRRQNASHIPHFLSAAAERETAPSISAGGAEIERRPHSPRSHRPERASSAHVAAPSIHVAGHEDWGTVDRSRNGHPDAGERPTGN